MTLTGSNITYFFPTEPTHCQPDNYTNLSGGKQNGLFWKVFWIHDHSGNQADQENMSLGSILALFPIEEKKKICGAGAQVCLDKCKRRDLVSLTTNSKIKKGKSEILMLLM